MKHLKPRTPSATRPASSVTLPGTTPPQKPTSTAHWPLAAARFAAKPSRVVVGGIELSGMSTSVVTPPIAAARVAVAKPSHSVRPGSLRCTCVSTMPGRIASSPQSSRWASPGTSSHVETRTILPPRTWMLAGTMPSGVTTRCDRTTSSIGRRLYAYPRL